MLLIYFGFAQDEDRNLQVMKHCEIVRIIQLKARNTCTLDDYGNNRSLTWWVICTKRGTSDYWFLSATLHSIRRHQVFFLHSFLRFVVG